MKKISAVFTRYIFTAIVGILFCFVECYAYIHLRSSFCLLAFCFAALLVITAIIINLYKDFDDCSFLMIIVGAIPGAILGFELIAIHGFRPNYDSVYSFAANWLSISIVCLIYKLFKKNKPVIHFRRFVKISSIVFYVFYIYALIYVLFIRNLSEYHIRKINLIPFVNTIIPYITGSAQTSLRIALINIVANIAVLMPLGFSVAALSSKFNVKFKWLVDIATVFVFSVCIEILQYIFAAGVTDIDDVILNVFGGIIGSVLFYILVRIYAHNNGLQQVRI